MLNDFFIRSLLAGIGTAMVAGPLGCFIIWRRMAYFGDTMAHAALLGIALSFLMDMNLIAGVFVTVVAVAVALMVLERQRVLPGDAILGILAHSTLSLGLVLIGLMAWLRVDLMGYLFGDILAVSAREVVVIWLGGAAILAVLAVIWRDLLADTVSPDVARAEGLNPGRARVVFMLLLAAVIAMAMKLVGILLITSLLIIPAAAARRFARTPETMAVLAALLGMLSVVGGLFGSLKLDTPTGPTVVVAALVLFLVSLPVAADRRATAAARGREQG